MDIYGRKEYIKYRIYHNSLKKLYQNPLSLKSFLLPKPFNDHNPFLLFFFQEYYQMGCYGNYAWDGQLIIHGL